MDNYYQTIEKKWKKINLCEQMANIGAEFDRALRWRKKNKNQSLNAFCRTIILLDASISDKKNSSRLKEICRLKELIVDYFLGKNIYHSSEDFFQKYFLWYNFKLNQNR